MADYTPTNQFNFSGVAYTPTTVFDFTEGAEALEGELQAVLDDVSASFDAAIIPQGNLLASLASVTAQFDGQITQAGRLSASLEGISAVFTAEVAQMGDLLAVLDGVSADFTGKNIMNQGIIQPVQLDDVVSGWVGEYDPNVTRFITREQCYSWQDTQPRFDNHVDMMRDQGSKQHHLVISQQSIGQLLPSTGNFDTQQATRLDTRTDIPQALAINLRTLTHMLREQGRRIDKRLRALNVETQRRDFHNAGVLQQMTKIHPDAWRVDFTDSAQNQFDFRRIAWMEPPPEHRYTPQTAFSFNQHEYDVLPVYEWTFGRSVYLASGHNFGVTRNAFDSSRQVASFFDARVCSRHELTRRPPPGKSPWIDPPRPDPDPEPPSGNTIEIPTRETYAMKHEISVTLVDETVIEMSDIKLDYDADSFAWQFSGTLLDVDQLSLVKPLPNGDSVMLVVTINGIGWHVLVENVNHRRQFGSTRVEISGRGESALLAGPYHQPKTGTQGDLLAIQQIADLHLPNGWTLDWQAVTWNVPGGVYSYQDRTPIQAIADIADAAGAIVVPERTTKTLKIIPRYTVLPWNFDNVTPDVSIPDAVILEVSHRPTTRITANGVYVHGGEIGGVLGFCRLSGTAGDVLIPTVSNPLMTDVVGVRAHAERLLAGEYTQPDIASIKLPMDGDELPLLEVGTFVAITIDGVETRGVVNNVSIDCKRPEITQTISLGEDTNNKWLAFRSLLPKDPLLVGTLISTSGNTSLMQMIGGGTLSVRGTGEQDEKYYIRSGQIQGEAPDLVQSDVVI